MTKQSLIRMIFHAWIFTFFYHNSTRTPKKNTSKKTPQINSSKRNSSLSLLIHKRNMMTTLIFPKLPLL